MQILKYLKSLKSLKISKNIPKHIVGSKGKEKKTNTCIPYLECLIQNVCQFMG